MTRSERLIQLVQALRVGTPPVRAEDLAEELGISVRSVYRDIDSLRRSGAIIDGEAGFGYTLEEDPALPPMLFTSDEMEALVLGLREVVEVGDPVLAKAAKNALAKVGAGLPNKMRLQFRHSILYAKRFRERPKITIDVAHLRQLTRQEIAVDISYKDEVGHETERRILPLAIVFLDQVSTLLSWCQLRQDYRTFRIDRISDLNESDESFRPKRVPMLKEYLANLQIDEEPE